MVVLTAADIVGKKAVESDALAPLKLRISVMTVSSVLGLLMYFLGLGESGLAPWMLLFEHPMIIVAVICIVLSEFLYVFSLHYVGMAIMEAISSLEGIVISLGLVVINLIFGKLNAVQDMLIPARLILICLIILFAVFLPNINTMANRKKGILAETAKEKRRTVIGVMIVLLAVVLGCGDSLIGDTLLDSGVIGAVDMTMTVYFCMLVPLPFFCFALHRKSKTEKLPFRIVNRYSILYSILFVTQIFMGILAVSFDAVRSEIMYLAYPVMAILGARIVLKEKYSARQSVCIWMITISAILFCVIDNIL